MSWFSQTEFTGGHEYRNVQYLVVLVHYDNLITWTHIQHPPWPSSHSAHPLNFDIDEIDNICTFVRSFKVVQIFFMACMSHKFWAKIELSINGVFSFKKTMWISICYDVLTLLWDSSNNDVIFGGRRGPGLSSCNISDLKYGLKPYITTYPI